METEDSKVVDHQYLWNSMNLLPPKLEFYESTQQTCDAVRKAVAGELLANNYRDSLFMEMVTLSRFMEDRKNKYRSDKGFRTIQKIKKVVERIHMVDLKSAVVVLKSNLIDTFVPSKQLGQWTLIKLQSNALLLQVLVEYCTYAASKLHQRLRTGHNWIEVTVALSMISRIWSLSKFLFKTSLGSYEKIISILNDLRNSETNEYWLSSKYEFPMDLGQWIERSRVDGTVLTDDGGSSCPSATKDVEPDQKRKSKVLRVTSKIKTVRDFKSFFRKEAKRRQKETTRDKCVSKKLDALQWHMLQREACKWLKGLQKHEDESEARIDRIRKKLREWFS